MAPQNLSIQSFYQPQSSSPTKSSISSSPTPGDGFTAEEIEAARHPLPLENWVPPTEYEDCDIASLYPGPKCVTFMGRVVNFFDLTTSSKMPRSARGCVKMIVKDGTGAVTIRLWYSKIDYALRLGQLVTVYTTHVSNGEHGSFAGTAAPLFISSLPERDRTCHLMVHENSDDGTLCKTPIGYEEGQSSEGSMTLKNFAEGGYEVARAKILVVVKSIGARKKVTTKKGKQNELVSVGVFDDTNEATLTLWGTASGSAAVWRPSQTVLLITSPGWRFEHKLSISLTADTYVDVDPDIPDTAWLSKFADGITKREHVNQSFPSDLIDIGAVSTSPIRALYTLADIDELARRSPGEPFHGYSSMVIMGLPLTTLHRRHMLMCAECCGMPLFANAVIGTCRQCDKEVPLRINPRIVGTSIDETGCVAPGKLLFSDVAWQQSLGRTPSELVTSSSELSRYSEHRLLFSRITSMFGWTEEVGKIAVAQVSI